jgi:hypothetical protein
MKRTLGAIIVALAVAAPVVRAHDVTHRGTVVAVEAARLQVKSVDAKTKKEDAQWYNVGPKTRTKRGEKVVPYTDAKITTGERIVLLVNHDSEAKMVITEIRLAAN